MQSVDRAFAEATLERMHKIAVPLSLSILVAACGGEAIPDDIEATESEIYGGSIDATNTWVGNLRVVPSVGPTSYCTAALVGPRVALSAAHCMTSNFLNEVRFTTGGFRYGPATDTYRVATFTTHPTEDVAILRFDQDVAGTEPRTIATRDFQGPYPLSVQISGYGAYYSYGSTNYTWGRLRATTGGTLFGDEIEVRATNGGASCVGDSGGPLFVGDQVWGVDSHGTAACNYDSVGYYRKVTNEIAVWIAANANATVELGGYQNPVQREDVNGDGVVTPSDALTVINLLNTHSGTLTPPNTLNVFPDVSGNGSLSPQDALIVINYLSAN